MKKIMIKNVIGVLVVMVLGLVFVLSQTSHVAAISVKEILGLEKEEKTISKEKFEESNNIISSEKEVDWAKSSQVERAKVRQIDLDYVSLLVANLSEQERNNILQDPALFKQAIENEANNASAVSAAITNKVEQDRNVEFLMRRNAENVLREAYLNRLIISKLPEGFPSDEQVFEYYESNKSQFVIPERIHVWQIFFKKLDDDKENSKLKKKVESLISDIGKGKKDFSSVALAESEHEQSKQLSGYMGLLKTDDLLPEMKKPLLDLKQGTLSKLVESEAGFHILKRGEIIKSETLELSQVKTQIQQLLIKQANLQLRQAIFFQARKEYPHEITDKKIEEWRLRLKTKTE